MTSIEASESLVARLEKACDRIESLETRLTPLLELKEDLQPIINEAVRTLILELNDLDGHFEYEDALHLVKRSLRNTRQLTKMLERLEQADEMMTDLVPVVGEATKAIIEQLGDLERQGVFQTAGAMRTVATTFSRRYTPDKVERMGEGLVDMAGLAEKATSPAMIEMMRAATETLADPSKAPDSIGMWGLFSLSRDPDVRRGMAVMLEAARAVGKVYAPENRESLT